jgi:hypothetical protein
MTEPKYNSERSHWRALRSNNRRSRARRRAMARKFKLIFPRGHRTSLKDFVERCGHSAEAGKFGSRFRRYSSYFAALSDIHPDAFAILVKYGTDYFGSRWRTPPVMGEPSRKECYLNARKWADRYNLSLVRHPERKDRRLMVYVEGMVHGPNVRPMLHSWNAQGLRGTVAMDWTFYSCSQWIRYRGIPLTLEEQSELLALTPVGKGGVNLLFQKKIFTPGAKRRLIRILERRRAKRPGKRR